MKNKKGFTLIELLTVIAILAVILIIAIPAILNVLEKAKKNSFIDSGISIVKSFEKGNAVSNILSNTGVTLPSNGNSISVSLSNINYENADDIEGNIVIRNESGKYKYYLYITNGEYSICNKEYDKVQLEDVEKKDGCGISLYPTLTLVGTESTTSSITITTSEEPGTMSTTTTCVYGTSNTYGSSCTSTSESESTITGLNPGTEYFFKICEVDSSNNEVSCVSDSISTKVPITGEIEIAASWPNTTSMDLTLSGITSNNALEYRCVVGTHDTGWQSSSTCNITNLTAGTAYTVAAYVRDSVITTAEVTKTTTIYTAKNVTSTSSTGSGECPTDTSTTVAGDTTYNSITLTGSCSQTNYTCNATLNSTANTNTLPETASVSCSGVSSNGTGGTVTSTSSTLTCTAPSSNKTSTSCSSRLASCKTGVYTISKSQSYSSCQINYSSCSFSSIMENTTGCGNKIISSCNGAQISIAAHCSSVKSYDITNCTSSQKSVCSSYAPNARQNCIAKLAGTIYSDNTYYDCYDVEWYYNSCLYRDYSCATLVSVYTTSYSYSSTWVSNYTAYYSSSTLTSTSYTYARTYTASSLVYSQDYEIIYTQSQVNPKVSTY